MKVIARLQDIPKGRPKAVRAGSREFLVYRNDTETVVCGNICPHHGARLCDGFIAHGVLTCPRHHGRFDLTTGIPLSPPSFDGITVYESAVEDGNVVVGRPRTTMPPRIEILEDGPGVVIIGGGAAGVSCAEGLRRKGYDRKITVLTDEDSTPYDRTMLSTTYLETASSPGDFLLRDPEAYEFLGIDIKTGDAVSHVNRESKEVHCRSGKSYGYNTLVLAVGARPKTLGLPGDAGVLKLRTRKDADLLAGVLNPGKKALIIGAGFLGLELAFTLAASGARVSVAAPEAHPLEQLFGEQFSSRIEKMLREAGIEWLSGKTAKKIEQKNKLSRVVFDSGDSKTVAVVVEAVGVEPATLPEGLESLTPQGSLEVDAGLKTADPDIFAVGDILSGRFHPGHWVTAMRQGWHVAGAITGGPSEYGDIPFFWTDLAGLTVKAVGHLSGKVLQVTHGDIESGDFLAQSTANGKVIGAYAVGYEAELIRVETQLYNEGRK